ncbi:MAG: radical SAM protein [Candidatus Brocadiaceae bacterium]|nr:radical SAM protein [Candidatus Brocadiaceae bacterium]
MPSDWSFVSVDMELTNQCSTNCTMCPRSAITRPKGNMAESTFETISDKLVSEGSLVTFSGMGDPLSHSSVFDWIYNIREKGGDVGIVINPASINKQISRKLIEVRPNSVTVSFPSIQKEVFEKLCPTVSYVESLRRTLELVDLSSGKVGLRVAGITTKLNENEQEHFVDFWKELGVRCNVAACHGRGGNLRESDIYKVQSIGLESEKCGLFQFHTFITWEGEVLACCHGLDGATSIGSLVKYDVATIAERKREILKNSMPFTACQQCDEPLRHCSPPKGILPKNRKERTRFFRSIRVL